MNTEKSKKSLDLERDEKVVKIVRTLARGIGPLLFLVMITLAIGQGGLSRLMSLTGTETIALVCILTMFVGILWSFTHEIAAGILIILGYIVLAFTIGKVIPGTIYPVFFIIGVLHIYCGVMEIGIQKRKREL